MSDRCPHCLQDFAARDHGGCEAYAQDRRELLDSLRRAGHGPRCAAAVMHVLGVAPPDRRLRVATAVIHAWGQT